MLGSALISDDAARWMVANVPIAAFYHEGHRAVATAIVVVADGKTPADIVTVANALRGVGKLGDIGGVEALKAMQDSVATAHHVEHYGRIVLGCWYSRQLIALASKTADAVEKQDAESRDQTIAEIERICREKDGAGRESGVSARDAAMQALGDLDTPLKGMVYVQLHSLDRILGGSLPGDLVTIGGRTGTGKTAMGLAILRKMAGAGHRVAYCGGEMSPAQLMLRMAAAESNVEHGRIRGRNLTRENLTGINNAAAALAELPMFFCKIPSPTLGDIRSFADSCRADVIIVDYLTRCTMPRAESMRVSVNLFMRDFKNMARERGSINYLMAQINRATDRADIAPKLADLRESGAIEDESDAVILLHSCIEEKCKPVGVLTAHVAKNRHGSVGTTDLVFDRPRQKISDGDFRKQAADHKLASANDGQEEVPF